MKDNTESSDGGCESLSFGTASSPPVQSNLEAFRAERTGRLRTVISQHSGALADGGEDLNLTV
ncbi:MAG: hypothetical protein J07HQX50_01988 [Haloquadratum sp. J07HQX50]|nr:MAG: hypothetical protein J07HQX50_01988 [Haloquadratum sp. J07HQX50]